MKNTHLKNINENDLQKSLRRDAEIPAVVHDRINKAYRVIESRKIMQKPAPADPFRWMKTGGKIAGGLAAVLAVGFIICVSDPVMARELPLVGSLFEKLQDNVSFFGNFADNASVLEEPEAAAPGETTPEEASSAETSPQENNLYTKTCNGLTITFSEIYANDQAIYLTMSAETPDAFPETMKDQNGKPIVSLLTSTGFDFKEDGAPEIQYYNLEGAFLDEHTYSCILRIDLAEAAKDFTEYNKQYDLMTQEVLDEMGVSMDDLNDETDEGYALLSEFVDKVSAKGGALQSYIKTIDIPDSFRLSLHITELRGDRPFDESEVNTEDPGSFEVPQYIFEGNWDFEIPVTVDTSRTVTLDINETNENGIGLKSVTKTPYELTVQELYDEGADSDCFLVALDAQGNRLPYNDSSGNTNNFAIQDRDISTVYIYILDYVQYMDELKGEENYNNNENKPDGEKWRDLLEQYAKYHKTLHFEK
ncbi:MAG TPA: DUF4179 domain-containing protein [Candidatus Blautia intestinipullorum]|nr:DUF4179 domain-containing protein [Candidatus Blautia intestinipullorum]